MNPVFSSWFESSSLSKAFLFLSFHNVQKKHNEAASHTFFHFLPTKEALYPSKVAFIEDNTTQETPKRDNKSTNSHNVEKCDQTTPIQQDKENIYLLMQFSRILMQDHNILQSYLMLLSWSTVLHFPFFFFVLFKGNFIFFQNLSSL